LPARDRFVSLQEKRLPASVGALDANDNAAILNGIFRDGEHGGAKWRNAAHPSSLHG
jgi:hypothetical protein